MSIFEKSIKQKIEEAKKNPVTILAFAYPYLLVIGLVIGLLYVSNFNFITRKGVPPQLPDTTATQQDLTFKKAQVIPPVDVENMKNATPELIAKGKDLYSANCSSCHGTDGKGDGPASAGLNPPPRNYTSNANWINGQTSSDIYKTLQEGIKGSAMASYSYMKPEDLFALAAYIRAIFIKNPPENTDSDLMMLDLTYNLSQGKMVPAQIPTSVAEDIIVKENANRYQKIINTVNSINNNISDAGAKLFKNVTSNEFKALAILSNASDWRMNEQSFINLVVNEVHQDGFNEKVFNLNGNDWDTLYRYLSKYM
jgi:mono/diheme cytochrome c family protein